MSMDWVSNLIKIKKLLPSKVASGLKKGFFKLPGSNHLKPYVVDGYLISFPKCGRTWLRYMLGNFYNSYFNLQASTQALFRPSTLAELRKEAPRILVSHDDNPHFKPYWQISNDKTKYQDKKVLLLVRDPRDVVVSNYFHYMNRDGKHYANDPEYNGSLTDFVYYEIGSIKSITTFYNTWAQNFNGRGDILIVKYEDLLANTQGTFKEVLKFLGFTNVPDSYIKEAVQLSNFKNMKNLEKEKQNLGPLGRDKSTVQDSESFKVRKGKSGGYKEYLDQKEIDWIEDYLADNLDNYFDFYKYKTEGNIS